MFAGDIEKLAKENNNFRKVLHTGEHSQVVAMCLPAGQDIGIETHPVIDQIFVVADGKGEALVNGEKREIREDDLLVVPAGMMHDITNTGYKDLKLITIYAPAAHPDGTVHATKAEAQAAGD